MTTIAIVYPYSDENNTMDTLKQLFEKHSLLQKNKKEIYPQFLLVPVEKNENYFSVWANYIVDTYAHLPDFVLFLADDPIKYSKFNTLEEFMTTLFNDPTVFIDKTKWLTTVKCNGQGFPHHPNLPVKESYQKVFGGSQPNDQDVYDFVHGGQAFFSQRRILSRPFPFYSQLKTLLQTQQVDKHSMERLWHYI